MDLDLGEILNYGFQRTKEKNGMMLAGLTFVVGLVTTAASQTFESQLYQNYIPEASGQVSTALALPIPMSFSGVLLLAGWIGSMVATIITVRTMASSETEVIPEEFYSENMASALLNLIAGSIALGLGVLLLGVALFIPAGVASLLGINILAAVLGVLGIISAIILYVYIFVSVVFWNYEVILRDVNFIEGIKNSFSIVSGKRLTVVLVLLVLFLLSLFVGILSLPLNLLGLAAAGQVVAQLISAFMAVFGIAVLVETYDRMR